MIVSDLPVLTDENIDPAVVTFLRDNGIAATTAVGAGLKDRSDREILAYCFQRGLTVVTHDSDFGWLAIAGTRAWSLSFICDPVRST